MQPFTPRRARQVAFALLLTGPCVQAQCPEEPPLQNWTGAGQVTCPCFVTGEEAGVVLDAPASHYPLEILRVGIGWGSQFGGAPQSLEQAIHIYGAGLPNPGAPLTSLLGPVLSDGVINEFDLEPLPGQIVVNSGPFAVTLEFANDNAGMIFAPSVVHDGNGCQAGKNLVFATPGGWSDACALGVTGDWQFHVVYRPLNCGGGATTYCTGKLNSLFCIPQIGATGTASMTSAQAFDVTADLMINNKNGLLFYGFNPMNLPFQGAFLCVQGPIKRTGVQSSGGNPPPNDCSGNYSFDFNAWAQSGADPNLAAGVQVYCQYWSRDPQDPAGFNTSLSDGAEFTIQP